MTLELPPEEVWRNFHNLVAEFDSLVKLRDFAATTTKIIDIAKDADTRLTDLELGIIDKTLVLSKLQLEFNSLDERHSFRLSELQVEYDNKKKKMDDEFDNYLKELGVKYSELKNEFSTRETDHNALVNGFEQDEETYRDRILSLKDEISSLQGKLENIKKEAARMAGGG